MKQNWKHAFMHTDDFNGHVDSYIKEQVRFCNYGWILIWFVTVMFMVSTIANQKVEINDLKNEIVKINRK